MEADLGKGFGAGLLWGCVAFAVAFVAFSVLYAPEPDLPDPSARLGNQTSLPTSAAEAPTDASTDAPLTLTTPQDATDTEATPRAPVAPARPAHTPDSAPATASPARPLAGDADVTTDVAPTADAHPQSPAQDTAAQAPPATAPFARPAPPVDAPSPSAQAQAPAPAPDRAPDPPTPAPAPSADAPASPTTAEHAEPPAPARRPAPPATTDSGPVITTDSVPPLAEATSEAESTSDTDAGTPDEAGADGIAGAVTQTQANDETAPTAPVIRTDRLPRIGVDPAPETPAEEAEEDVVDASLPAVLRHAAEVSVAPDQPRLAVILIDDGINTDARADLIALPFPVTIAIDPLATDAAEAAAAYRAAGMEVLMLASALPARATASDLDVLFEGFLAALPESIGLIDTPGGGFQTNRPLAQLLVPLLERDGHALVSYARGLNAAAQIAANAGLAHGQVFRVLDDDGESVFTIRRYLDRAVFEAGREGSVIVLGRAANLETMAGLLAWRMEGRADQVALVPVSAALGGL